MEQVNKIGKLFVGRSIAVSKVREIQLNPHELRFPLWVKSAMLDKCRAAVGGSRPRSTNEDPSSRRLKNVCTIAY